MLRLAVFPLLLLLIAAPAVAEIQIALQNGKDNQPACVIITGLSEETLAVCSKRKAKSPEWEIAANVRITVDSEMETARRPAMLGAWTIDGNRLCFTPRFPFSHGTKLRVFLDQARLLNPNAKPGPLFVGDLALPKRDLTPIAKVEQIYPTRNKLPENQLRFYIQFSRAMSRGEAYDQIQIRNDKDEPITDAFLEIGEELWDPSATRFTLLFDPGRVKKGLKPREDLGPVLKAGKNYTLVIDGRWKDAEGRPLIQKEFLKAFTAGPADVEPPDPHNWKIDAPPVETVKPLRVRFDEPLDFALLQRVLCVMDANGKKIKGTIAIAEEETLWNFTPHQPWKIGRYRLVADTILEDLAANRIGKPFEVDVFHPIPKSSEAKFVEVPFDILK